MIRIKGVRVSIEEVIDYKKVIAKRLKVNKEDIKLYKKGLDFIKWTLCQVH